MSMHKALQQLRSNGVVLGVFSNFDKRLGKLVVISMHFVESGLSKRLNFDHWNNYIACNPNTPLVKTYNIHAVFLISSRRFKSVL